MYSQNLEFSIVYKIPMRISLSFNEIGKIIQVVNEN